MITGLSTLLYMKTVNALQVRKSLGATLDALQEGGGGPVMVLRDRKPAAVLISLEDYERRFVDVRQDEAKAAAIAELRRMRAKPMAGPDSVHVLRELRRGRP